MTILRKGFKALLALGTVAGAAALARKVISGRHTDSESLAAPV